MTNTQLPDCIICDIDGTIAINNSGRSPYDWKRVGEDALNSTIADILKSTPVQMVFLFSGRDEECRELTQEWLRKNNVYYDTLVMRPEGDVRKDSIVKRELFKKYVKGKYNVKFVLDDRNQVVDMWRNELGLICLQVAEGDF